MSGWLENKRKESYGSGWLALLLSGKTFACNINYGLHFSGCFCFADNKATTMGKDRKTAINGQHACPCGASSFLTWGKHLAPSGHGGCPKLCPKLPWKETFVKEMLNTDFLCKCAEKDSELLSPCRDFLSHIGLALFNKFIILQLKQKGDENHESANRKHQ